MITEFHTQKWIHHWKNKVLLRQAMIELPYSMFEVCQAQTLLWCQVIGVDLKEMRIFNW